MEEEIRAQLMANQQLIAEEETAVDWEKKVCIVQLQFFYYHAWHGRNKSTT